MQFWSNSGVEFLLISLRQADIQGLTLSVSSCSSLTTVPQFDKFLGIFLIAHTVAIPFRDFFECFVSEIKIICRPDPITSRNVDAQRVTPCNPPPWPPTMNLAVWPTLAHRIDPFKRNKEESQRLSGAVTYVAQEKVSPLAFGRRTNSG